MDTIFHEKVMSVNGVMGKSFGKLNFLDHHDSHIKIKRQGKQEGSLCAQHCLNALLQNQYFSAVDLAQIGRRLDDRERERMAEGGVGTNEYQRFIEEPSSNFDDSGFFSVQVINEALSVWGLDMILYNSQNPVAVDARENPTQMTAFICNYNQHWFCVRKLGLQWFNLNSLLSGPELISDTYLALFLTQLQQEGYSIFIVTGQLPECEAEQLLRLMPATQLVKPSLITNKNTEEGEPVTEEDDGILQETLRVSKELIDNDDTALQRALQLSMEGYYQYPAGGSSTTDQQLQGLPISIPGSSIDSQPLSQEELREKRLAFLNKSTSNSEQSSYHTPESDLTEEEQLQRAISMSMENS